MVESSNPLPGLGKIAPTQANQEQLASRGSNYELDPSPRQWKSLQKPKPEPALPGGGGFNPGAAKQNKPVPAQPGNPFNPLPFNPAQAPQGGVPGGNLPATKPGGAAGNNPAPAPQEKPNPLDQFPPMKP